MTKTIFISIILLAGLSLSGCQKSTVKNPVGTGDKQIKVEVDKAGQQFKVEDKESGASVTVGKNKIPSTWPDDFPVYDGEITAIVDTTENISLSLKTAAKVSEVKEWYQQKFSDSSWQQEAAMEFPSIWNATYLDGQRRASIVVTNSDDGDFTVYTLSYSKGQ
jgi:hypothetical protein